MVVPVPGGTSGVGGLGIVEVGENTDSVFQVISLVA